MQFPAVQQTNAKARSFWSDLLDLLVGNELSGKRSRRRSEKERRMEKGKVSASWLT